MSAPKSVEQSVSGYPDSSARWPRLVMPEKIALLVFGSSLGRRGLGYALREPRPVGRRRRRSSVSSGYPALTKLAAKVLLPNLLSPRKTMASPWSTIAVPCSGSKPCFTSAVESACPTTYTSHDSIEARGARPHSIWRPRHSLPRTRQAYSSAHKWSHPRDARTCANRFDPEDPRQRVISPEELPPASRFAVRFRQTLEPSSHRERKGDLVFLKVQCHRRRSEKEYKRRAESAGRHKYEPRGGELVGGSKRGDILRFADRSCL